MKVSRFIALAAIAMMVVAALGIFSARSFAQTLQPAAHQSTESQAQVLQAATAVPTENLSNVEVNQQGEQTTGQTGGPQATEPVGAVESTEAVGAVEPTEAPDAAGVGETSSGAADAAGGQDQQSSSFTGSITTTESATGANLSESAEAAALASQAKISADQANAAALAANPGATVVKTDLGDENGNLVYSVELSNGSDVKVDAGNAKILATDAGGEN